MANHQEQENSTVMGYAVYSKEPQLLHSAEDKNTNKTWKEKSTIISYPVDIKKPLIPISWAPLTAASTATTATANSPKPELQKIYWEDMSRKENVFCVALGALYMLISFLFLYVGMILARSYPPNFKVDSLNIYSFNISSSRITSNWNIKFSVAEGSYEPVGQYFKDVKVSVFYKENIISSVAIEPFFRYRYGKAIVTANIGVSSADIDGSIAQDLVADWSSGSVNFNLTVNATVLRNPTEGGNIIPVTVSCEEVKVEFSSDTKSSVGILSSGSHKCKSKWDPEF